jgi:cytoskeletal protein CcmA (bactofilin family)
MTPAKPRVYSGPRLVVRGLVRGGGFEHVGGPEDDMARVSIFPAGTTVDGDVLCDEDVIVEGRINGTVLVGGVLLVEDSGAIRGDVRGGRVVVRGIVVGSVEASEGILVESGARVVGDLYAPRVHLEEGSVFRGRVEIVGEGAWDVNELGSEPVKAPPVAQQTVVRAPHEKKPRRTRREPDRAEDDSVLGTQPRRRTPSDRPPELRMPVVGRAAAHRRANP